MRFFNPQQPSKAKSVVAGELERVTAYGRFELDPQSVDPAEFGVLDADLYPVSTADPAKFFGDLASLVHAKEGWRHMVAHD